MISEINVSVRHWSVLNFEMSSGFLYYYGILNALNFTADKWDSRPEMRSFSPINCSEDDVVDFGKKYSLGEGGILFKIKLIFMKFIRNIKALFLVKYRIFLIF